MIDGEEDWGAAGDPASTSAETPLDADVVPLDLGWKHPETSAEDVPEGSPAGSAGAEGGTADGRVANAVAPVDDQDDDGDQQPVEPVDGLAEVYGFDVRPDPTDAFAIGWGTEESIEELVDPGWLDAESLPDIDSRAADPVSGGSRRGRAQDGRRALVARSAQDIWRCRCPSGSGRVAFPGGRKIGKPEHLQSRLDRLGTIPTVGATGHNSASTRNARAPKFMAHDRALR